MACMMAKPVVDGLEGEVGGRALVLRTKLTGAVGEALGDRYQVGAVPTFLAFDARGRLALRSEGRKVPVDRLRAILLAGDR
jgi:hypothetical protein